METLCTQTAIIHESDYHYPRPTEEDSRQPSLAALEDHGQRFLRRPISSEQALEAYGWLAMEDHMHGVVTELCKIPNARGEFHLGSGVWCDNHANALNEDEMAASRS